MRHGNLGRVWRLRQPRGALTRHRGPLAAIEPRAAPAVQPGAPRGSSRPPHSPEPRGAVTTRITGQQPQARHSPVHPNATQMRRGPGTAGNGLCHSYHSHSPGSTGGEQRHPEPQWPVPALSSNVCRGPCVAPGHSGHPALLGPPAGRPHRSPAAPSRRERHSRKVLMALMGGAQCQPARHPLRHACSRPAPRRPNHPSATCTGHRPESPQNSLTAVAMAAGWLAAGSGSQPCSKHQPGAQPAWQVSLGGAHGLTGTSER